MRKKFLKNDKIYSKPTESLVDGFTLKRNTWILEICAIEFALDVIHFKICSMLGQNSTFLDGMRFPNENSPVQSCFIIKVNDRCGMYGASSTFVSSIFILLKIKHLSEVTIE